MYSRRNCLKIFAVIHIFKQIPNVVGQHFVPNSSVQAQPDPYNVNSSPEMNVPDEVFVILGNVMANCTSLWGEKVGLMSDLQSVSVSQNV